MIFMSHRFSTSKLSRILCRALAMGCCMAAFFTFTATAQGYKALQDKVRLLKGKQSVGSVLRSLQQQTNYTFLYDPALLSGMNITLSGEEQPLAELLHEIDQQFPLEIEYRDHTIALRKASVPGEGGAVSVTGMVTGQVLNERNEALSGVTINSGSGGRSVVSKVDGTYLLRLRPGAYTLQFSHVSYTSVLVQDVVVAAGKQTAQDVVLYPSSGRLKDVVVTSSARKETVAALYARQKNSAAITDGISAEQIARTPDRNVGEVLKRVSGLATMDNKYVVVRGLSERYNGAMLNGQLMPSTELNRKNFSYDIIPSNIIDNITVIKTITPDMSAEFGGGLVNVETKVIPTSNFFTVSIGTSVNSLTTGKPFYSLELEGREYLGKPSSHRDLFGKLNWKSIGDVLSNTEGAQGSGSDVHYPVNNPGASFANNWGIYKFHAQPSQNYQLGWGHVMHLKGEQQLGFMASVSYRNTLQVQDVRMSRDGFSVNEVTDEAGEYVKYEGGASYHGKQYGFTTNIGAIAGVGYTTSRHKFSLQTLYLNLLDQQLLYGSGVNVLDVPNRSLGYYDNTQWTRLWQTQLKGAHAIGGRGIKLDWSGSYTNLDRQRPDNHYMRALLPPDSLKANEFTIQGPPTSSTVDRALRMWTRALENDLNWDVHVSVPFHLQVGKVAVDNSFKAGYGGWYKDRLFYVARVSTGGSSPVPAPIQDFFSPENTTFDFSFDRFGDDFHRNASLHAVYGMFDTKVASKLRLVWGVRGEYYNLDKVNEVLDVMVKTINDSRSTGGSTYDFSALYNREKNFKLFPSANLTYGLTPKMNLRLSYAKSIIRPDLRELSFFREYDFELSGEYENSAPILSTTLQNVDFRYEFYPGAGELLSFSLFYKKFDNPMEIYNQANINLYSLRNNKTAENRGIEVEFRKSLSFTQWPVVKNMTFYANGTRLFSQVKTMTIDFNRVDSANPNKILPRETVGPWENRPQQGASNYMLNAGFYYDTKPVSLSLLYNYVSNRLFRPAQVYGSSLFERPVEALDAQVAVRFLHQKAQLRMNVSNLLNSYSLVYWNAYENGAAQEAKPSTKDLLYQKGKDNIHYEARPGRTFSFTLSYSF